MSISGLMKTLAFHQPTPRKSRYDVGVFRKANQPTATRRQDVANEHQFLVENLWLFNQKPKESRAGCPGFPYR